VARDPSLLQRLDALRPRLTRRTVGLPGHASADLLDLLASQSRELSLVHGEIKRVNAELALTNRGVLDLVAELSAANESLVLSGAGVRQLADQQAALADLGHRAVASRDLGLLAIGLVGVLRRVLGIQAVAVLRFDPQRLGLDMIASEGCRPEHRLSIGLTKAQARNLRRSGTLVADPSTARSDFALDVPDDARSSAVVAVHTPVGPWGVLVACDMEEGRFNETTTTFLEAAVSLFAFSIARMAWRRPPSTPRRTTVSPACPTAPSCSMTSPACSTRTTTGTRRRPTTRPTSMTSTGPNRTMWATAPAGVAGATALDSGHGWP
jgi:hypothetical protein